MKRDQKINDLQKGLIWFREEALTLGEKVNQNKKDLAKWKERCESLEDDKLFLEKSLLA